MRKKLLGMTVVSATVISAVAMTSTASAADAAEERAARSLEHLQALQARTAAEEPSYSVSSAGEYQALGDACLTDPTGDTALFDGSTASPQSYPRADIDALCAAYGEGVVTVGIGLVQPTDPDTDPAWGGDTGLVWAFDVDGDDVDDYVAAFVQGGAAVTDAATGELLCDAYGEYSTSQSYLIQFEEACIGTPSSYRVLGFASYDPDPSVDGATYVDDTAFTASISRGTTSEPTQPPPSGGTVEVGRLAGTDRYGTAVKISQFEFPGGASHVFIARADGYADALAGGALTAGPVLLVPQCGTLPAVVRDEIRRLQPQSVMALGGPTAVCDSMLQQAGSSVV